MINRNTVQKIVAGIAAGGVLAIVSLSGVASADGGAGSSVGVGELQECTISKSMDASPEVGGTQTIVYTGLEDAAASDPEWKYLSVRRFDGPTASTKGGNAVAIESITLTHEGIDLD